MPEPKPNHLCPLCDSPNDCALAKSGSFETPCWCKTITIDHAILTLIPKAQRNQSCICKQCASNDYK